MARAAGIRDIRAAYFADNPASGNVLRKLGFRYTGRIEQRSSPARGKPAECLVFEEGVAGRMTIDPAVDLYQDALPALAA
jgi:RimJ/RimL family protein N-acetyltransferase